MSFFVEHIKILLAILAVLYSLSILFWIVKKQKVSTILFGIAWGFNLAIVVYSWIVGKQPPLGTMYHVMVFVPICFLPIYQFLRKYEQMGWLLPYLSFSSLIFIVGSLAMTPKVMWKRLPALQSPWFTPHIAVYMISYALFAVAFILTFVRLFKIFVHWLHSKEMKYISPIIAITLSGIFYLISKTGVEAWTTIPVNKILATVIIFLLANIITIFAGYKLRKIENMPDYRDASYQLIRLAFPLMTFGMLSGALWAEEAWGGYWSWDLKENWSLVTWLLYLIYFHVRTQKKLQFWEDIAQVFAFIALFTTFILVNLLPKINSLHSYS